MWPARWMLRGSRTIWNDGEVRIYAEDGGASITLRRNGHVEIEGDLFINGAMYVPPVS